MQYSDDGTGVTADSLNYFRTVRSRIGEIVEADIRFPGFTDPFDPYLMILRDATGNEIRLSGCTTGYNGEGPRGAMDVLLQAGFPPHDARRVMHDPELVLRRTAGRVELLPPRSALRSRQREIFASNDSGRSR